MTTRNLVILFDGTWNKAQSGGDNNETNVVKLHRLLPDSSVPHIHYEEGVGIKSEEEILGGMFGKGIDERILGALRFLQSRYKDKGLENRIFIFGFSRGAFTARVFAQLLYYCGLPKAQKNFQKAWSYYYKQDKRAAKRLKQSKDCIGVDIEMVGVWDTVKSTLDPDREDAILYPNVKAAYHAMALDEKRRNFTVLRFDDDERVTQVWFAGVHSDIGGSYPENESHLSDITLAWMVEAARTHGLEFIPDYMDYLDPRPTGTLHDSYEGIWTALGEKRRVIPARDSIHVSVKERLLGSVGYKPTNLPPDPHYV